MSAKEAFRVVYVKMPTSVKKRLQLEAITRERDMQDIVLEALLDLFGRWDRESHRHGDDPVEAAPTPPAGRGVSAGLLAHWLGRVF